MGEESKKDDETKDGKPIKDRVVEAYDKTGDGTKTGALIGGVGALLLSLFSDNGNGGGFFSTLFAVILGALAGGLAGDFIKKDGPIFSKDGLAKDTPLTPKEPAKDKEQEKAVPNKPTTLDNPKLVNLTIMLNLMMKETEAGYIKLPNTKMIKKAFSGELDDEKEGKLTQLLIMASVAKNGKIDLPSTVKIIKDGIRNYDGTVNVNFLERNNDLFGLNDNRVIMVSKDGDKSNIATGKLSEDGQKIVIEKVLSINGKGDRLPEGKIDILDLLKNGADLKVLSAKIEADSKGNPSVIYRESDGKTAISVGKNSYKDITGFNAGDLNKDEINGAVNKIIEGSKKTSSLEIKPQFSNLSKQVGDIPKGIS